MRRARTGIGLTMLLGAVAGCTHPAMYRDTRVDPKARDTVARFFAAQSRACPDVDATRIADIAEHHDVQAWGIMANDVNYDVRDVMRQKTLDDALQRLYMSIHRRRPLATICRSAKNYAQVFAQTDTIPSS